MNINATLFLQAVVFAILVWFTMTFVWPPITKALDERARKIADGLAAAEKAKSELSSANQRVEQELAKSRDEELPAGPGSRVFVTTKIEDVTDRVTGKLDDKLSNTDREKAIEAGCDDYDTKPIELPRLLGKIETLLGGAVSS